MERERTFDRRARVDEIGSSRTSSSIRSEDAELEAERELAVRVSQNDRPALVELYDRTASRVYAAILCSMDPGDEAGEILREVFQRFWDERDSTLTGDRPLFILIGLARRVLGAREMQENGRDSGTGRARSPDSRSAKPVAVDLDPRELLRKLYFGGDTVPGIAARSGLHPELLRATLLTAMDELRRELNAGKNHDCQ